MYTLEVVKNSILEAYKNNNLLAQNIYRLESHTDYVYKMGDVGCAIGVILPEETAALLEQDTSIHERNNFKIVARFLFGRKVNSFEDLSNEEQLIFNRLGEVQTTHDRWKNKTGELFFESCRGKISNKTTEEIEIKALEAEREFLKLVKEL